MNPYLIADDLSGALEAGAAFNARGWRVTLPLSKSAIAPSADGLTVISTETRNASPADAISAVRQVVAGQRTAGARLLFKKIDSTLRGPLGAELSAIIEELRPPLIVVCPANPRAGRTVKNGVLYVDGVSLDKSEFRHDPHWPARTGDIGALLASQGIAGARHLSLDALKVDPAAAFQQICNGQGKEVTVLVTDAETMSDVEAVVSASRETEPSTVFVGSGAVGTALANLMPAPTSHPETLPLVTGFVVLCGSRHPASDRQLEWLQHTGGAIVIAAGLGESLEEQMSTISEALAKSPVVAVRFFAESDSGGDASASLLERISQVAVRLPRSHALYLTGGETAWVACRALEAERLEIVRELQPGVVAARLSRREGPDVLIVTKPGGFGSPEAMGAPIQLLMK